MGSRRWIILGAVLIAIPIAAVGWYLASPLFIDRTVDEPLPVDIPSEAELNSLPPSEREALADSVQATAASMPGKAMEEEMPAGEEPTLLREGAFVDADAFHQGSGIASVLELADGQRILRFESFSVTNGPDLHVLLASGISPQSRDDLGEYVDLGELKGNIGDQNYEIPQDLDLDAYQSVVIYCVPFHVIFSVADLSN